MEEYNCPVCEYRLDEKWEDSQKICPSCYIQFGYDDASFKKAPLLYKLWREEWIKNNKKPLSNEQIDKVHKQANNLLDK